MSNAQNKARETRRINVRRNFLANQIACAAFCEGPDLRAQPIWMSSEILEWARLTQQLRVRRAKKEAAK